jgi:asparagine synthetase B (glutamine-hydrolysing)
LYKKGITQRWPCPRHFAPRKRTNSALTYSGQRISAERLKRATNILRHRGPDSQGAWLSPDQRVGLGHARLSIIDLTTGDQPIANEDERIHIVVNGEFYDFERQRRELERRGHLFRTRSDSEIALHLYEEFGTHCVQQLRGEFAFVLWDESNQMLFAARDRFGIKPLYYAVQDGTLYLASEIKALFAAGVPARWDHEYFYQHATGPAMPDRTLFDGVHQVPPGHCLTATTNGMRILRYWEFSYPRADELEADTRDESAWIEEFAAVFDEAVKLRMRADVPVGCYLSGGLDSCAVLGFAARRPDGNGALSRGPRAIPGSSRRRVRLSHACVVENTRRDREIFAPRSGQTANHRDRVPPAKASLSLATGDHGSEGTVPSNDAGYTARFCPRIAPVLRSEESRCPARPTALDGGVGSC